MWKFTPVLMLMLVAPALADEIPPDSPAQKALFDSDHLHNVTRATRLDYDFRRSGQAKLAYEDRVEADIRALHEDGGKDVWISFLSGERQMPTLPVTHFHGNPLLMAFLEHDVKEMRDDTGQPAAFYRNRIRHAFLDGAKLAPVTIELDGRKLAATDISITPFRGADGGGPATGAAAKTYDFILCDAVPGTLYQIRSRIPIEGGGEIVESMTFHGATP